MTEYLFSCVLVLVLALVFLFTRAFANLRAMVHVSAVVEMVNGGGGGDVGWSFEAQAELIVVTGKLRYDAV